MFFLDISLCVHWLPFAKLTCTWFHAIVLKLDSNFNIITSIFESSNFFNGFW